MAQTPESKVKDKIKKILKQNNVYFTMPIGTGYGNAGVPDFICCIPPWGKFLAIEAKANGGKPTALQIKNLRSIGEAGGYALVVNEDNLTDLEVILNSIILSKPITPQKNYD
jgi:hypothetical protein